MSDEKEKLSWREIDELRRQKRSGVSRVTPRGEEAKARVKEATKEYLRKADELFSSTAKGKGGENLGHEVEEARGRPRFDRTCKAYIRDRGAPIDADLASIFLDSEDEEVLSFGLEGLLAVRAKGALSLTPGLRARVRTLAQHPADTIAYLAEDILR